jgi:hypothetical protein
VIAQDFAELGEAGFYFFADGGGYFVVPAGVFHVHERPSLSQKLEVRMRK